jgi:hypothetical protein
MFLSKPVASEECILLSFEILYNNNSITSKVVLTARHVWIWDDQRVRHNLLSSIGFGIFKICFWSSINLEWIEDPDIKLYKSCKKLKKKFTSSTFFATSTRTKLRRWLWQWI